ncbi:hypothetical protein [Halocalculus aciditolerans]|uniref:hypothetical protein n=1 Tax=Halocalculus aciditolerans TaxID=1383812 RepID=UPI00166DDCE2|nr:hypothetical protein [Halocalculus aciditolerans]
MRTTAGTCPTCHADVHGHVYRARGTDEHGWICPVCDAIHDPDEVDESGADGELVADGGDQNDRLYFCAECRTVTVDDVDECPACGSGSPPKTLAFVNGGGSA